MAEDNPLPPSKRWQNFSMWRGRLPHWRADDVTYYATFRHRRELNEAERFLLYRQLIRTERTNFELVIVCVLPEKTELMFRVKSQRDLGDVIEKAKTKAGNEIIKKSGERFPPFYMESYDHIVRDDGEFEEFWTQILESPTQLELCEDPGDYPTLLVPDAPE